MYLKYLFYLCKIFKKRPFLGIIYYQNCMKDRIKALMESQHMTQQTFAQFIQVSPATLSSIFNGRTRPTLNMVEAVKNKIPNLSMEWLMFGKEPMYLDEQPTSGQPSGASISDSSQQFLDFDSPSTPQKGGQDVVFQPSVSNTPIKQPETIVKYLDKPQRQITEIRVFYDDQTWETFVPKK